MSVDPSTERFYSDNAAHCVERWEAIPIGAGVSRHFASSFVAGGTVLDIGCGSGRDAAALLAMGFDAYGLEPIEELRSGYADAHPELVDRVAAGALPALPELPSRWPSSFDGIVCSAMLMHLPHAELPDALSAIRSLLRPGGRLLVSIPNARASIIEDRDGAGRLFSGVTAGQLQGIAERTELQVLTQWLAQPDAQLRPENSWDLLLFERAH